MIVGHDILKFHKEVMHETYQLSAYIIGSTILTILIQVIYDSLRLIYKAAKIFRPLSGIHCDAHTRARIGRSNGMGNSGGAA